jgi:hypothetical protein
MEEEGAADSTALDSRVAQLVVEALRRVKHGEIRLTVHNGEIVEVASTTKTRLVPSTK